MTKYFRKISFILYRFILTKKNNKSSSSCLNYWLIGAGFLNRPSPVDFGTGSNDIRFPKRICWAIGNLSKTYKRPQNKIKEK